VSSTDTLDVAVIGRGMIGSAAARHLAEGGTRIALVGPGEPDDRRASDGPFSSHPDEGRITRIAGRTPIWTEVAARSIERYDDIATRSGIGFHVPCGLVTAYHDAPDWVDRASRFGSRARLVDRDWVRASTGIDLDGRLPILYEPDPAGHINPRRLVAAQSRLASLAGATVVDGTVAGVRRRSGGFEISGAWGAITAHRVLLATGAFGADLFDFSLDVERRPRTTLMAEAPEDPRLPSAIVESPPDDRLTEIYWVPPLRYPDGVTRIKIGGHLESLQPLEPDQLVEWFHGDGDPTEIDALHANLGALLPDAPLGPVTTAPCVITATPSGHPYIGWVADQVAVAIGGNGSAAKSSDELGRIAAGLFGDDGWASPIDPAAFAPVLT
jgi:sarcosine oxidase